MSRLHPRLCFFFAFLIFVWPIPSYPTLGSTGCGSSNARHHHHRRLPRVVGQRFITVDPRGRGDFISVQAAVESVPENNRMNVTILVTPGYYIEKVVIPPNKPYITLQGAGRNVSIIEWQDVAGDDNIRDIFKYQIQPYATTASVSVFASYFTARNISFRNSAPASMSGGAEAQAAALQISGDKAYFSGCGFYGGRGTLHDDVGRHYFKECYIEGSIDFILGNGRSMYKDCELHSIATRFGSIAAQGRTSADERTGFAFVKCRVTGRGPLYVGRALAPYSRIVFSYTFFDDLVAPSGWDDWDPSKSTNKSSVFFGMYKCWGPGSEAASEGSWVRKLDYKKARPFLVKSFVNGRHWMGPGDA